MKRKSAISLIIVIILIAALGTLAVCGLQIGALKIMPLANGISQGLDLRGGVYAVYEAKDEGQEDYASLLSGTMAVLQNRLAGKGYTEATVSQQGLNRIRVEIPDVDDPNEILTIIGQPAVLQFKDPNGEVIMEGDSIKSASAAMYEGKYVVNFDLNDSGTTAFAKATAQFVNQIISIELDGAVISAPTVNTPITGGSGYIEGNMTLESAQNLAMLIQSGALPLAIEQLEMRTISATLGENALSTSVLAAIIGIALVMVYMIVMYRLPGCVSVLALCIYILIDMFLLAVIPGVQLTLPGIAGIILSVGMAVDANVIIFERIKEEIASGKTVRSSVESGFKRAFAAILDSNVTTIIAGVVLMFFGTGTIKGFAVTLTIGVLSSMITAIFITKYLLRLMVELGLNGRKYYGVKGGQEA